MLECSRWFREKLEVKCPTENPCCWQCSSAQASLLFTACQKSPFTTHQAAKQHGCQTKKPGCFFFFFFSFSLYFYIEVIRSYWADVYHWTTIFIRVVLVAVGLILPASAGGSVGGEDSVSTVNHCHNQHHNGWILLTVLSRSKGRTLYWHAPAVFHVPWVSRRCQEELPRYRILKQASSM